MDAGPAVTMGQGGAGGKHGWTSSKRQMKLTAFCHPPGHWRMPDAAPTDMEFPEVVHLAKVAERGKMDMLFFQDSAAVAPAFYLPGGGRRGAGGGGSVRSVGAADHAGGPWRR